MERESTLFWENGAGKSFSDCLFGLPTGKRSKFFGAHAHQSHRVYRSSPPFPEFDHSVIFRPSNSAAVKSTLSQEISSIHNLRITTRRYAHCYDSVSIPDECLKTLENIQFD